MSFNVNEKHDSMSDNMEQEDKVNIEETSINLVYVKKEFDEELKLEGNQYKIALTFESIYGESSVAQRSNTDNLIGYLDDDVIMETGSVKLEDVEDENKDLIRKTIEKSYCNKCGGNYKGYCPHCSSLSHILNNITPNINPEPDLNTTPVNMLEIREVSSRRAVFALKTLPKGIIFGPFEGVVAIESTTGLQWKIEDKKLVNDQNGNWMKYIQSVANHASKNLDVFQFDGILYFETSREIQEGEELLVCYGVEEVVLKSNKDEEFYLVPVKKEEYPKVFACTLCCLGFRLERCLLEHKSKCPQGERGSSVENYEIIQCRCCKVWLEKQEHLKSHILHCVENNRLCYKLPGSRPRNTNQVGEINEGNDTTASIDVDVYHSTATEIIGSNNCSYGIDCKVDKNKHFHDEYIGKAHSNTSEKIYKCSQCSYQTNRKDRLTGHLGTHTDIKPFECDICKKRFTQKGSLKVHIQNTHSNITEMKHNCSECSYQTNYRSSLKMHLYTHNDIKPFQCSICKKGFGRKDNLKLHIVNHHSNISEKEYKCTECSYQTNYKNNLKIHLCTHSDTKAFECDICKKRFSHKSSLIQHIRNQHSNTNEKEYKCSECSFQTNLKGNLKLHLNVHNNIKPLECDICKKEFVRKGSLQMHIRNHHSNTNEKEYKCSECCYQTNNKGDLKMHLYTHTDIKRFECHICNKTYIQRKNLKFHIQNKHSNTNEKEYKCSECSYQTNSKYHYKRHVNTHNDIKPFECDICKKRFSHNTSLKDHIKNQHNTSEKEYKCSECSYHTNRKGNLKIHLNTHNDIKPFECDTCKQRFNHKTSLKLHIKNKHSNTSEKEYKCSECCYQTNDRAYLTKHLSTHMDIKPFECHICKKRYSQKKHVKLHIQNKHSNTSETI